MIQAMSNSVDSIPSNLPGFVSAIARIPGVMNPNLTPFSRSGVDLPNGQKIYAKVNGKRFLILTVTDSIPHGARIDVARLIEKALNKE